MNKYFIYRERTCETCQKNYKPTSGRQRVCSDCKKEYDKGLRKKWLDIPENRERLRQANRSWHAKNRDWLNPIKRKKHRERIKNNPVLKKASYLRGKDRLTLLRYTAEQFAICQECGAKWPLQVHHKDFNPNNHSINNLEWICVICHHKKHGYLPYEKASEYIS